MKQSSLARFYQFLRIFHKIQLRKVRIFNQQGRFGRRKIQLSSKVAKFAKWIGIDLTLIFYINDFSCAILSFWNTDSFSIFCVEKKPKFFFPMSSRSFFFSFFSYQKLNGCTILSLLKTRQLYAWFLFWTARTFVLFGTYPNTYEAGKFIYLTHRSNNCCLRDWRLSA